MRSVRVERGETVWFVVPLLNDFVLYFTPARLLAFHVYVWLCAFFVVAYNTNFSPKNRTLKSIVKKGCFLEEVLFLTTKIPLLKNRTFPYHKLNTANLYRSDISPGLIMPKASTLCSVRQKGSKSIFLKKITYCFKKYLFLKEVGTFC